MSHGAVDVRWVGMGHGNVLAGEWEGLEFGMLRVCICLYLIMSICISS
jgi:hypothetical protein